MTVEDEQVVSHLWLIDPFKGPIQDAADVTTEAIMEPKGLVTKIQGLSDLELALLLSLVASQHCLIETESEALELACQELQLVRLVASYHAVAECCGRSLLTSMDSHILWFTAPRL